MYLPPSFYPLKGAELPECKVKIAFKGETEEQLDVNEGDYVVVIREDPTGGWWGECLCCTVAVECVGLALLVNCYITHSFVVKCCCVTHRGSLTA